MLGSYKVQATSHKLQLTQRILQVFSIFIFSLVTCYLLLVTNSYAANCPPNDPLGCAPAGVGDVETLFSRLLNISVGAAFIALVVVLVVAGIKFITSGGDAKSLTAASQAIVWGLLGILFMAIAWLIIQLIAVFTGINMLTSFDLQVLIPKTSP